MPKITENKHRQDKAEDEQEEAAEGNENGAWRQPKDTANNANDNDHN